MGMSNVHTLPDDIESLKALILAERETSSAERHALVTVRAERDALQSRTSRLEHIIRQLRRLQFGRKSEKLDTDQLNLGLEDLEAAAASIEAEQNKSDAKGTAKRSKQPCRNRGQLPKHLPREEVIIEPEQKDCPCCGGRLHVIGEDVSELSPAV